MATRHRSTVPNGIAAFDHLPLDVLPEATLQTLTDWAESFGVHPSRVAAISVKHGAVKLLLNVRNDHVGKVGKHRRPLIVPATTEGARPRLVREWRNFPGAPTPPAEAWAELLAAVA
jgi:hypothetical protein